MGGRGNANMNSEVFAETDRKIREAAFRLGITVENAGDLAELNEGWDGEMNGDLVVLGNALDAIVRKANAKNEEKNQAAPVSESAMDGTSGLLTMMTPLPIPANPGFYSELLAISSGTLSALSGMSSYAELDELHTALLVFYLHNQDKPYETWMDVWNAFQTASVN